MDSIIKIGGRELPVHASLKTLIDYKSTFGTDLFEDLDKIQNIKSDSIGSLWILLSLVCSKALKL